MTCSSKSKFDFKVFTACRKAPPFTSLPPRHARGKLHKEKVPFNSLKLCDESRLAAYFLISLDLTTGPLHHALPFAPNPHLSWYVVLYCATPPAQYFLLIFPSFLLFRQARLRHDLRHTRPSARFAPFSLRRRSPNAIRRRLQPDGRAALPYPCLPSSKSLFFQRGFMRQPWRA